MAMKWQAREGRIQAFDKATSDLVLAQLKE